MQNSSLYYLVCRIILNIAIRDLSLIQSIYSEYPKNLGWYTPLWPCHPVKSQMDHRHLEAANVDQSHLPVMHRSYNRGIWLLCQANTCFSQPQINQRRNAKIFFDDNCRFLKGARENTAQQRAPYPTWTTREKYAYATFVWHRGTEEGL